MALVPARTGSQSMRVIYWKHTTDGKVGANSFPLTHCDCVTITSCSTAQSAISGEIVLNIGSKELRRAMRVLHMPQPV